MSNAVPPSDEVEREAILRLHRSVAQVAADLRAGFERLGAALLTVGRKLNVLVAAIEAAEIAHTADRMRDEPRELDNRIADLNHYRSGNDRR